MKPGYLTSLAALLCSTLLLNGCSNGNSSSPVAPVVPFVPNATDVVDPVSHYSYPEPSLTNVKITYVPTTINAADPTNGYYIPNTTTADPNDYVCQPFDNTLTYPITLTLADVDRDIDETDVCVPEIKVNFQADGYPVTTAYNAKMRMRGSSTRLADQKSYRVKLRSTSPCSTSTTVPCWRDEITLQFNKHPYDLTRVRNKLAFDLMRDIPYLNSLRTQFVHITYNDGSADADYGLFTHVEKMGKEYLLNRSYDPASNIYKAEDFYFVPDTRLALVGGIPGPDFESVLSIENSSGNHSALLAMVNAVSDEAVDFNTTFEKYFNRNNYLAWLATNILMGNHDTLTQNFALYQPAGGERFYFLPWDYDGAFGFEDQPNELAAGDLYDDWQLGLANWWGSPLHRRFIQQPGNLALLKAAVEEVRSNYLTAAQVQARLDSYKSQVETLITQNPDLQFLPTYSASPLSPAQQWSDEYNRLTSVVETNYNRFLSRLQNPMPYWQAANVDTANNKLVLEWDAAVDLQGNPVTYTIKVGTDPTFATGTVLGPTTLSATMTSITTPPPGTYYMQVIATDNQGHSTHAFDRTDVGNNRYFGVFRFVIP